METVYILGNGFDLAHGLPTSHTHFYTWLINNIIERNEIYGHMIQINADVSSIQEFHQKAFSHESMDKDQFIFTNDFLRKLCLQSSNRNWFDIEISYFNNLSITLNTSESVHELNNNFGEISKCLEDYLSTVDTNGIVFDGMKEFFDLSQAYVINFNYTKTCDSYCPKNDRVINFHGELYNESNPIVFGYAASINDIHKLRVKESEYVRYIKRTLYRKTSNVEKLNYILEDNALRVVVLGHSCSYSDQLILNQIFTHDSVEEIEIAYYENYEDYFQKTSKVEMIMDNEGLLNRILHFDKCRRIPQITDGK